MTSPELSQLHAWVTQRGWKLTYAFGVDQATGQRYASAVAGPVAGLGRTTDEALVDLQQRLIEREVEA